MKKRVLIGTLVRQKPAILKEYLESIAQLTQDTISIDYAFVEDNLIEESTEMLVRFREEHLNCEILHYTFQDDPEFEYHKWTMYAILRIAEFKNKIIKKAIEQEYDYLFLVDSDTILRPITVEHLISTEKDIVSEVHWTFISNTLAPNAWLYDNFDFAYKKSKDEKITKAQQFLRMFEFHHKLRKPGLYPVGGICDIILMNRKAMLAGVNFEDIYNVSFVGESAHFAIRAAVLGFQIYIDTCYPAYHIFDDKQLANVNDYKKQLIDLGG